MFDPKSIAFALITLYPKWYKGKLKSFSHTDKIRGDLALNFIQKAISLGFQLVIVDGKSSNVFQTKLSSFSKAKIINRQGMKRSPAKRQAFKAAANLPSVRVIVACEPEKISLLNSVKSVVKPILENTADIVVLKREESLFKKTYPDYMYRSEKEANKQYNQELKSNHLLSKGTEFDFFFGPRAFSNTPKILSLFTQNFSKKILPHQNQKTPLKYFYPEELSNSLYFPIVIALKKGLRVKSVEIPFSYPNLQKTNETVGAREFFIKKRQAQRLGILLELMYLLNYLQDR